MVTPNPFLGVFFHWLGGLASGSFYVPYRAVKKWAWEVYWLVGGFFSWIIVPWLLAALLTKDPWGVLKQQSTTTLWWTYFFGALWGFGGLTFGLTMRYLGMSLGMGAALGYCAAFGTLVPPIFKSFMPDIPVPENIVQIASTTPGKVTLFGVLVCLMGIAVAAFAGLTKEREMPDAEKKKAIAEFSFTKGILVATFSGVMSACFSFALTAGNDITQASKAAGTSVFLAGLPRLVVVLLGGFTTNFIWCLMLNLKNGTGYQYFSSLIRVRTPSGERSHSSPLVRVSFFFGIGGALLFLVPLVGRVLQSGLASGLDLGNMSRAMITGALSILIAVVIRIAASFPKEHDERSGSAPELSLGSERSSGQVLVRALPAESVAVERAPMLNNYVFSALAGTIWYFQFFFYSMGESQMGKFGFASWTLHMASIIIFSTMWGWILHEWKGSSRKAHRLIGAGITILVLSTGVIGWGTFLKGGGSLKGLLQALFG